MDEKEKMIKSMSDDLCEKLKTGTLFGSPIDMSNNDQVVVAAYEMGRNEVLSEQIKQSDLLSKLRSY